MEQTPGPGSSMGAAGPPPGWYPDPTRAGGRRYWDGTAWTEHAVQDVLPTPPTGTSGFAIAALILGIFGLLGLPLGLVAKSRIKQSGGRLEGNGLATAGIVLSSLWLAFIALAVMASITGIFDHDNASRYKGDEREVARVVDDAYQAFDDGDGDRVCEDLLTPRLADLLGSGNKTCAGQFRREGRTYQPDITVKRIVISGDRASVDVTEGDTDEQWSMLRQDGRWRIDSLART